MARPEPPTDDVPPVSRRRRATWLAVLAAVAFSARLAAPLADPGSHSAHGYHYYVEMAENVVAGRGLARVMPYGQGVRRAIRTPLYPLVLAGFLHLRLPLMPAVAVFGAACGAVSCVLAALLAARLFGASAGWLTGWGVALWPQAVMHDAALQDTALYTVFLLGFVLALHRVGFPLGDELAQGRGVGLAAVATGLLGAAAILTRVTLLPTVALLLALVALGARRSPRWRAVAVAGIVVALGLLPWMARNARVVGAPVLTSDVGRSFWLGNNPQTFSVYPRSSIDRAEERAWLALPEQVRAQVRALGTDELRQDAWFRDRALAFVREQPLSAAVGAVRKAWATFGPWHSPVGSPVKQLVHLLSYGPVLVLAVIAAVRWRRRRDVLAIPVAAFLLAVHSAVFFGHSSYRTYLDPLLIALAASVVVEALRRRGGGALRGRRPADASA